MQRTQAEDEMERVIAPAMASMGIRRPTSVRVKGEALSIYCEVEPQANILRGARPYGRAFPYPNGSASEVS